MGHSCLHEAHAMTLQMGASTFLVMAIFSYPGIWRKFTVTQEFVNPMVRDGGQSYGRSNTLA